MVNIEQKLDREIAALVRTTARTPAASSTKKKTTYREFLADPMMMISVIHAGLPYSIFDLIRASAPLSDAEWAAILGISTKSLLRHKQSGKEFKPLQSEKIMAIAEVVAAGKEAFGDVEKFKLWLGTPNFALGRLRPLELLRDSYGKDLVLGELTRIEYGILA